MTARLWLVLMCFADKPFMVACDQEYCLDSTFPYCFFSKIDFVVSLFVPAFFCMVHFYLLCWHQQKEIRLPLVWVFDRYCLPIFWVFFYLQSFDVFFWNDTSLGCLHWLPDAGLVFVSLCVLCSMVPKTWIFVGMRSRGISELGLAGGQILEGWSPLICLMICL